MRLFGKEFPVLLACALAVTACGGGAGQQEAVEYPVITVAKSDGHCRLLILLQSKADRVLRSIRRCQEESLQ